MFERRVRPPDRARPEDAPRGRHLPRALRPTPPSRSVACIPNPNSTSCAWRTCVSKMVERRSCVHRDYRSGSVIMALWAGLGEYMQRYGFRP